MSVTAPQKCFIWLLNPLIRRKQLNSLAKSRFLLSLWMKRIVFLSGVMTSALNTAVFVKSWIPLAGIFQSWHLLPLPLPRFRKILSRISAWAIQRNINPPLTGLTYTTKYVRKYPRGKPWRISLPILRKIPANQGLSTASAARVWKSWRKPCVWTALRPSNTMRVWMPIQGPGIRMLSSWKMWT